MKLQLSLVALLFFATFNSFAQPVKGNNVIGANLNFQFNTLPTSNSTTNKGSFSISPTFGRFISEKFLLEGGLGYAMSWYNYSDNNNFTKQNSQSASLIFGVTRFFSFTDKFYFTLGANISPYFTTNQLTTKSGLFTTTGESNNLGGTLSILPGLSYFINQKWMIFTNVGLVNYQLNFNLENDLVSHNVNAKLMALPNSIGFRYIFSGKTKP